MNQNRLLTGHSNASLGSPRRASGCRPSRRKTFCSFAPGRSYAEQVRGLETNDQKLMAAFSACEEKFKAEAPNYIVFSCRFASDEEPIKLGVPFRAFEEQVEERMSRLDLYRDLPRGRKRRGWKKQFLETLTEAARDLGEISEEEILRTVRSYRRERRTPEITVAS